MMLGITDWRTLFLGLGAITATVALIIFVAVPREPGGGSQLTLGSQIRALGTIYSDRIFWRLAPLCITTLATGMAVQGLWAGPWFRDVAVLGRAEVANHLFGLNLGLMAGLIGTGVLADLLGRMGWSLLEVMRLGVTLFMLSQIAILYQADPTVLWMWVCFGFISNMAVLAYPRLAGHFPLEFAGSANTGLNVLMMGGAFGMQYGIGAIIELWPTTARGGYSPDGYGAAFSILLTLQALALLWFLIPAGTPDED